jgi:hypothetical protein
VRRAVVGEILYCGLDRDRRPLRGDEVRPCWEVAPAVDQPNDRSRPGIAVGTERDLVPVMDASAQQAPSLAEATEAGWTLFGDADLERTATPS